MSADDALAADAELVLGETAVSIEALAHSTRNTATRRVCRVTTATRRAVVKIIAADSRDPSDPYAAQREPILYARGLPAAFADAGIRLPSLLAQYETAGDVALWMEDAAGVSGAALTPRNYERVARRLGRAQGAADNTTHMPWSRGFLPRYLTIWDDVGWEHIFDDDAWNAPLIREHFPDDLRRSLLDLCADRHTMLDWADRLPQTICHHDVWPNNVFDNEDATTLIDWAFAGTGAIGCDPGNLVTDSCGDLLLAASLLGELDAGAAAGYRAGLRDAGWTGDFTAARLGMCLMSAKWCWLTPHMLRLASHESHGVYGQATVDSNQLFAERAAMLRFYTVLADEARALARQLGF